MAKYKFGKTIGGGGFGIVREAERDDGWECAVKLLKEDHDAEDLRRFHREVRMQAQLDHSNIVSVSGMNLSAEPPWFIMPRALSNLRTYLAEDCGEDELPFFYEAARGVEHAHKNGIIHRDLKPENILIYEDDEGNSYAVVSDFGLGRLVDRDTPAITPTNVRLGTVEYVAPEQWKDAKHVGIQADIYSLGKILYEILTGSIPHPTMDFEAVPQRFVYIIQKATSEEPSRRYQSVSEMLKDLDLVTKHQEVFEKPVETARQMIRELLEDQGFDSQSLESLARFLCENADDYQMLIQGVPHISDSILQGLVQLKPDLFEEVFRKYDFQVDGSLTFEYCDVVSDFYEKVFHATQDRRVQIRMLQRLPILGYTHNRWHVGTVFARIVSTLTDPTLIMAVRDILAKHSDAAGWCKSYLQGISIPRPIRQVLKG